MKLSKRHWVTLGTVVAIFVAIGLWRAIDQPEHAASAAPTRIDHRPTDSGQMTMSEVLDMAEEARQHMADTLDDYTARLVKQEVDRGGATGAESEMAMKVQTRLRGEGDDAPMRVYLRFEAPESVKGREVIWGEDLFDGKMAVHEVGLLVGLKTIWLDPEGMLAMQGQRYPISEIGMVRLVEKLIERGEKDRNNPDIRVSLTRDHLFDGRKTHLVRVRRSKPSDNEDDFSLAEIVFDPERRLILSYRSFGWPDEQGGDPPLLEAYAYHDVETNVGLTEEDFDPKNPDYNFPAF